MTIGLNGGKRRIRDLLRVSDLILSVVEVPNIKEAINSCQEEETTSGSGPATIGQIGLMISGLHDGGELIFGPDLGGPITDR
jgi:hypothetical protein